MRHPLTDAQKSLIREISSGVIRWKGYLDRVVSMLAKKDVKRDVRHILWIAVYQIAFMKKGDHHIVNETVEFVKKGHGLYTAGFVNAFLRRFIRERQTLSPSRFSTLDSGNLSIRYSFPSWITNRWVNNFGHENTERLLSILNTPPEFVLRVDLSRMDRDDAMGILEKGGIHTRKGRYSGAALYVDRLMPVFKTEIFRNGIIHVQDESSQLAALSFQPREGDVVLDACAGLGTKTAHIFELYPEARIIAMDNAHEKMRHIGAAAWKIGGDALSPPFSGECFDYIVIDAPCSSLGIIRKHPELKWRRKKEDIVVLGRRQRRMIHSLWNNLKKGGYLVYSVCSFEREETVDVIEGFGKDSSFLLENPLPFLFNNQYFLSLPHETGMDGFFIAKLKKI